MSISTRGNVTAVAHFGSGDGDMTSRYYWVDFAKWNAMTPVARSATELWAKSNGLEVAVDLRDDHQRGPIKPEPEEDVDV